MSDSDLSVIDHNVVVTGNDEGEKDGGQDYGSVQMTGKIDGLRLIAPHPRTTRTVMVRFRTSVIQWWHHMHTYTRLLVGPEYLDL